MAIITTYGLTNVVIIAIYADMEPANKIITALGGPTEVAKILGVHRTRVSMWKAPKEKGGTDGLIPMWHAVKLFKIAKDADLDITASSFFDVPEDEKEASQ